jgi:hypothetical protein
MSWSAELEEVQRRVAGLKLRVELQARHLDGLTVYSDLAKRASDILAQETERLRLSLIQLEDMERATRGR